MNGRNTFADDLLRWYAQEARDLPWRRRSSPYSVLVSEFMLQQTQVATVIPYFTRWMGRFPDFESLAAADEEEVLRLWEGLGYYRRARSLHAIALLVAGPLGGALPDDYDSLLRLPGVGPYTAGALASLAFNRPEAALDGNVERLMTRLLDIAEIPGPALREDLRRRIAAAIPSGRARDFNQALMELGALVCLPRNPLCLSCPLKGHCLALARGTAAERPLRRLRPPVETVRALALLVTDGDRFLLLRHRDGERWQGLWEFPTFDGDEESVATDLQLDRTAWKKAGSVRHSFTRYRREISVFSLAVGLSLPLPGTEDREARWVAREELGDYPLSAGSRKIREGLIAPAEGESSVDGGRGKA